MIRTVGRRLLLVFGQPDTVAPASEPDDPVVPEVDFVAYTEDRRLSGRIALDGDRLSDILNDYDEYLLQDVRNEPLAGGEADTLPQVLIRRDELLFVRATGPRGDRELRTRTIRRALTIKTGPYLVTGDVHSGPGIDPLLFFRRRRPMVPLTDVSIEFQSAHGPEEESAEAVVVNRELVDWVRVAESGAVARDLVDPQRNRLPGPTR